MKKKSKYAQVIAVDMGYGHQRTAYPLRHLSENGEVVNANNYPGMPKKDKKIWKHSRSFYEFISRFKRFPLIGNYIFSLYDKFQKIPAYYPKRDLSHPDFSLKQFFRIIKKGWGRHFIEKINSEKPLISTFFIPAFMAEEFGYKGEIFCVICDADISRSWVSLDPKKSRIKYFAPTQWVVNRLKLYGVKEENIFLTGYPLPKENIGSRQKMEILKNNLKERIINLDLAGNYRKKYQPLIKSKLGELPKKSSHPLTIMFSIGGAGAQTGIVSYYLKSLAKRIRGGDLRVFLSAGIREAVKNYFEKEIQKYGIYKNSEIIFNKNINEYFSIFNQKLKETDILWTKPSELSFYSSLGIPLILAPSIGSQEDYNRRWLLHSGLAANQENPKYASQWIFDSLESGRLAEMAMEGFVEGEKFGTYNIEKICLG